jgi:hypothetical protein
MQTIPTQKGDCSMRQYPCLLTPDLYAEPCLLSSCASLQDASAIRNSGSLDTASAPLGTIKKGSRALALQMTFIRCPTNLLPVSVISSG